MGDSVGEGSGVGTWPAAPLAERIGMTAASVATMTGRIPEPALRRCDRVSGMCPPGELGNRGYGRDGDLGSADRLVPGTRFYVSEAGSSSEAIPSRIAVVAASILVSTCSRR